MRIARVLLVAAATASTLLAALPASAHGYSRGPRVSFSVGVGVPAYYPYAYGPRYVYPYYVPAPVVYAPAPVVVVSPPVTYIEQQPAPAAPPPQAAAPNPAGYWYYCAASAAYYPYVQQCATGWQRVSPTPPGP